MTLTQFLLARIAEDEAAAGRGSRHNASDVYANDNYGCLLVDPHRVLAECEAKRRIVKRCRESNGYWGYDVERALALPYADHPDYRDEWKP